jgi:hypothetical protein
MAALALVNLGGLWYLVGLGIVFGTGEDIA